MQLIKRVLSITLSACILVLFSGCGSNDRITSTEQNITSKEPEESSSEDTNTETAYNNHLFETNGTYNILAAGKYDFIATEVYTIKDNNKDTVGKQIIDMLSSYQTEKIDDMVINKEKPIYTFALTDQKSLCEDKARFLTFCDGFMADSLDDQCYRFEIDPETILDKFFTKYEAYPRYYSGLPSYNRGLYRFQLKDNVWQPSYLSTVLDRKKNQELTCSLESTGRQSFRLTIENNEAEEYTSYDSFSLQVCINQTWYYVPTKPNVSRFDTVDAEFTHPQYGRLHVRAGESVVLEFDLTEFYDDLPEGEYRISFGDLVCGFMN